MDKKTGEVLTRNRGGGLPEYRESLFAEVRWRQKARTARMQRGLRLCFMNVILVGMASVFLHHRTNSFPEATGLPSAVSR